jgi:heme/copper-type cytochrome/quinol oxidase subunit 2
MRKFMFLVMLGWTALVFSGLYNSISSVNPNASDATMAGAGMAWMLILIVWAIVMVPLALLAIAFRPSPLPSSDKRPTTGNARTILAGGAIGTIIALIGYSAITQETLT